MGQEQSVFCNVVAGLEITGINNHFFSLPEVYTQKRIPDNLDNIVTQEEISGQSENPTHLGNVDLLFGANASQVMEPWEVINSSGTTC